MMRPPSATNSNHVRAGEFGDAVEEDSGVGRGSDKQMAEKEAARAARIELLEQARFEAFRVAAQVDIYDLVSWVFFCVGGMLKVTFKTRLMWLVFGVLTPTLPGTSHAT